MDRDVTRLSLYRRRERLDTESGPSRAVSPQIVVTDVLRSNK